MVESATTWPSSKLDIPETGSSQSVASIQSSSESTSPRKSGSEDEPFSYPECVDLAKAVRYCSDTLIEGVWSEESTVRGRTQVFTPRNFQSAKAFLRASVETINSRRLSRSLADTPLTSRPRSQPRMPTCHGCHGPMGHSQHQGSAPGKDVCTLPHSMYCRGGVVEDLSWRACPPHYQYNTDLDLASATGFESTMSDTAFGPSQSQQQPGLVYSTPVIAQTTPSRELVSLGARSRYNDDRLPGRVSFADQTGALLPPQLPPRSQQSSVTGAATSGTQLEPPVGGVGSPQQVQHQIPVSIQTQIDNLRVGNQVENTIADKPDGMTIRDLRGNEYLRSSVENYVDTIMKQNIPALSSAPTARLQGQNTVQPNPMASYPPIPASTAASLPPRDTSTGGTGVYAPCSQLPQSFPYNLQSQPTVTNQPLLHIVPQVPQPAAPQQQVASHLVQGDVGPGHVGNRRPTVLQCGTVSQPQYNNPSFSNQAVQFTAQSDPPQHQPIITYHREYRCSPTTGRQWIVDVPVTSELQQPVSQPEFKTEWRIHPYSGTPYQVQVPVPPQHPVQAQQVHPNQVTPPQFLPTQWPLNQLPSEQQHHISQQLQVPPQLAAAQNNSPNFPVAQHDQQFRHEWRIHPQTGTTYQVQVPVQVQRVQHKPVHHQVQQQPPSQVQNLGHQVLSHTTPQQTLLHQAPRPVCQPPPQQSLHPQQLQQQAGGNPAQDLSRLQQSFSQYCDLKDNSSLTRQDQVAGIVSMLEGGSTKDTKESKVIDFAKKCPVRWSKQATMANINLPLYAWGAVAEVESSMSGRTEAMSEAAMLGKIRHLQNILEVCCLSSSSTDFTGYGWTLARDYATKVENEVDQKLASWQNMQAGVRTSTLLSSQMEHPRPAQTRDPKKVEKKELCTTYNKCKTEGKCEYEVSHPGKVCQRKHECSYCREKKKQSWRHQAWCCQNKASEG